MKKKNHKKCTMFWHKNEDKKKEHKKHRRPKHLTHILSMEQRIWQNSSVDSIRIIQPMNIVYPCNDKSHEIWQQLGGFRMENSGIPFIVYRHINNKFCLFETTTKQNSY